MSEIIEKFLSCECHSDEHTLRFAYDEDGDLYTSVYLNQYRGFWKRVLVAIKYVFGYKSRYGDWDCFVANSPEKIKELKDFFNSVK